MVEGRSLILYHISVKRPQVIVVFLFPLTNSLVVCLFLFHFLFSVAVFLEGIASAGLTLFLHPFLFLPFVMFLIGRARSISLQRRLCKVFIEAEKVLHRCTVVSAQELQNALFRTLFAGKSNRCNLTAYAIIGTATGTQSQKTRCTFEQSTNRTDNRFSLVSVTFRHRINGGYFSIHRFIWERKRRSFIQPTFDVL